MTPQHSSFVQSSTPRPNNLSHVHRDRGYRFVDRDPVMQQVTEAITSCGRSLAWVSARSGVSVGTLQNWMNGSTRRPQNLTVTFVMRALGFEHKFVNIATKEPLPEENPAVEPAPVTVDEVYVRMKPRVRDQYLGRVPAMIRARREERQQRRAQSPKA